MATHKRYSMQMRRRREGKTNYKRRLSMLKSRKPRLVVRKTNTDTIVQIVRFDPDGDVVIASASAKELSGMGWKGSSSNIPAAYLAGYLAGVRAAKQKVTEAVVDIGMQRPYHGGRLFAAVKGAADSGLAVPVSDSAVPDEDRLTGAHIDEKMPSMVETVKKKAGA